VIADGLEPSTLCLKGVSFSHSFSNLLSVLCSCEKIFFAFFYTYSTPAVVCFCYGCVELTRQIYRTARILANIFFYNWIFFSCSLITGMFEERYPSVVVTEECPIAFFMTWIGTPDSPANVPNVWRSEWK
jgi:hypothetical protein